MDPLSGVASVIAVVQLTQLICGILKGYFHDVREARADIDRISPLSKVSNKFLLKQRKSPAALTLMTWKPSSSTHPAL